MHAKASDIPGDSAALDRAEILQRLRIGDVEADQVLTGMTMRHLTGVPITGSWSVRDVVAHMVAHEQFALAELRRATGAADTAIAYADLDSFNAGAILAMRPLEPRMVMAAWRTSRREVIALVERLPDDAFDPDGPTVARLGDTIGAALGNTTWEHWAGHVAGIRDALSLKI